MLVNANAVEAHFVGELEFVEKLVVQVMPARRVIQVGGNVHPDAVMIVFEIIRQKPLTVIDVGHTPDGISQSLASLKTIYGTDEWILVVGASLDKKAGEIVGALAPSFDTIVCTGAHHKGADAKEIAVAARNANPHANVHIAASIEDAVDVSLGLATSLHRRIYVAGGLFLAIEYATIAKGGRARDLNFF